MTWFVAGLAVAVLAAHGIGVYYRRLFGTVQPGPFRTGGPPLLMNAVIVFILLLLQDAWAWAFDASVFFVAVILAYTGIIHDGLRRHYLGIALACLLFAQLRSFDVHDETRRILFNLLIGGGLIAAGIGDHLVLRRFLHTPRSGYVDAPV